MTKSQMMDWFVDNLHKLEVNSNAAYCEQQKCPALSFRSLTIHDYRPWSLKGESRERLRAALEKAMTNRCTDCDGSGGVDSGGFTPWGAPIIVPCPTCSKQK